MKVTFDCGILVKATRPYSTLRLTCTKSTDWTGAFLRTTSWPRRVRIAPSSSSMSIILAPFRIRWRRCAPCGKRVTRWVLCCLSLIVDIFSMIYYYFLAFWEWDDHDSTSTWRKQPVALEFARSYKSRSHICRAHRCRSRFRLEAQS